MPGRTSKSPAILAVAAVAVSLFSLAVFAQQAQTPAGNADRGKALFYAHGCYGCHGFNGETGVRDLVGTGSPIVENVDLFLTFLRLRADQAPLLPSTRMPNYPESALSDRAARDIFAYIRTFRLDAPDVDEVPTLEAIVESASRPYEP
jgi:mono/diheme cytochrome c family protein